MEYDIDELSLLKEAREHRIGKFREVERHPGAIERVAHICQNLAQTAFSRMQNSQQDNQIKRNDHLRLG